MTICIILAGSSLQVVLTTVFFIDHTFCHVVRAVTTLDQMPTEFIFSFWLTLIFINIQGRKRRCALWSSRKLSEIKNQLNFQKVASFW